MTTELPPLPEPWDALRYEPDTGFFYWTKHRSWVRPGDKAGSHFGKYVSLRLGKKTYMAHRCAVYMMTGAWPADGMDVDHIDGNGRNNAWSNLRVVTRTVNNQNLRTARRGSRSGLIGAHWNGNDQRWISSIKINGKVKYLGRFPTAEDAHAAYLREKREHHAGCTI